MLPLKRQPMQEAVDAMLGRLLETQPALASRGEKAARIVLADGVERLATAEFGVLSDSGRYYVVSHPTTRQRQCQCPDHRHRGVMCAHILAALLWLRAPDYDPDRDWLDYSAVEGASLSKSDLHGRAA